MADQHTAKAFDVDLQDLARMVAEMGGLAEKQIAESVDALARRDGRARAARRRARSDRRQSAARDRGARDPHHRAAPADGGRPARDRRRAARLERSRAHRRPRQEHRQARDRARRRDLPDPGDPRGRAHVRPGARAAQAGARRLCAARRRQGDGGVARRRGDRRGEQLAVPRAAHLHDGGPAQHHVLHAPAVLREKHRTDGRPCDEHRRDRLLHRRGARAGRRAPEGRHHGVHDRSFPWPLDGSAKAP